MSDFDMMLDTLRRSEGEAIASYDFKCYSEGFRDCLKLHQEIAERPEDVAEMLRLFATLDWNASIGG